MKTTAPARKLSKRLKTPTAPTQTKLEDGTLDAEIRKGLVLALEDLIAELEIGVVHKTPVAQSGVSGNRSRFSRRLGAPEAFQDVGGKYGDSRAGRYPSQSFLSARFAVGKLVSTDHDGDYACNLRNRTGEECLQGSEAVIEG
jgi:hypothetical protein